VSDAQAKTEADPGPAHIITRGDTFVPRVLAVSAGAAVEFRNPDGVYHNTFSISRSKRFDLGKLAPGASRSVTFDKPGIVNLYCDLHPNATGFVLVLPTAVFAHADASGTFALPALPQGTYTVTAWHPRFGERRARVNLDGATDVSISLRF